jgi:trehalose synthase
MIYEKTLKRAKQSPYQEDITVIMENNASLVNAVQRHSDVVLQKSLREGFGLTVSEAMLKATAVAASDVGGIPRQIEHGKTGFLHEPRNHDAFANTITNLLDDEEMKTLVGERAATHVKNNFLMTRLLDQYLSLFEDYLLN